MQYLDRAASSAEVAYWTNIFLNGRSNEQVIAGFISSQEYFTTQAGDNIVDWIYANYRAVLGRNPSASDVTFWEKQLE